MLDKLNFLGLVMVLDELSNPHILKQVSNSFKANISFGHSN